MRTPLVVVLVIALVALAPIAAIGATDGPGPAGEQPDTDPTGSIATDGPSSSVTDRPDPETDVIGWENGYWYNESISVDQADGLNESELNAVVSRGMARVEHIRQLEFRSNVPVNVISRETYSEDIAGGYSNVSTEAALHQNVKFEALFMIGEDDSAIERQESTRSASVLGYYSPAREEIVIVSENTTSPKLDEITLAQELFHALQDQVFQAFSVRTPTREDHNAYDGLIEGDGNYVDYLYQQACESEWSCLQPSSDGTGGNGGGGDVHPGILYLQYQPYSDGPAFVRDVREAGGWEAVNALYEDPPASTEQTIHPNKYGSDPPTDVSITDTSSDRWSVPATGGVPYAKFGEAGMFMMFLYPSLAGSQNDVIVNLRNFVNYNAEGNLRSIDPFNYLSRYSTGWDGDLLYPYITDSSAETNETGYVWKSVWDSSEEAGEFIEGYEQLLSYHGGEEHADGVWRIAEGSYADAFYIDQREDTVMIVNAPNISELSAVRTSADIPDVDIPTTTTSDGEADTSTTEQTDTTEQTTDSDDGADTVDTPETTTTGAFGPGFGPVVVILSVLGGLLVLRVRHR